MSDAVEKPTHPWNDPDNDGHDCVDCPPESILKCDKFAHDEAERFRDGLERVMRYSNRDIAPALKEMSAARRRGVTGEELW